MSSKTIEQLAERYPSLYVAPADTAEEAYGAAARRGIPPMERDLSHFVGTDEDWLHEEQTPAGPVDVVFLKCREDFENFLRCTVYRCRPNPIPATIGAMTIDGLADWSRIRAHHEEYIAAGGADWPSEFKRFVADRKNFCQTIVIISEGPYSDLSPDVAGYGEVEWLRTSRDIRLYHELTHVMCRRLMPNDVLPIWDEITADLNGLLRATGAYDPLLALRFLGIENGRYVHGRLEEYLDERDKTRIDQIAHEVSDVCEDIADLAQDIGPDDSYDLVLKLKREPLLRY